MWSSHVVYLFPVVDQHSTIQLEREHSTGFTLNVNLIQHQERGTNSISGTELLQTPAPPGSNLEWAATTHWYQAQEELPWEATILSNSKPARSRPCTILTSTAHLPLTAPMSHAGPGEAGPLWCTGFPYTQVTRLICYLLKPPNLAAEGDCMIAKIIGEN